MSLVAMGRWTMAGMSMSRKSKDILSKSLFGAIALSLTFGAVAFGRDRTGTGEASGATETAINRDAKADRAGIVPGAVQTRTVLLRLDGLSETSVLVRLPLAKEARKNSAPSVIKPRDRKTAVACEPPVSVLTEIAKQLQPGRCVT
jgi:hypothetical protein